MLFLSKLFKKPVPPNLPVVDDKKLIRAVSMREALEDSIFFFCVFLIPLPLVYVIEYGFTLIPYFWHMVILYLIFHTTITLFYFFSLYFSATRFYRKNSVFLKYQDSRGAHEAERTDTNGKDDSNAQGVGDNRKTASALDERIST